MQTTLGIMGPRALYTGNVPALRYAGDDLDANKAAGRSLRRDCVPVVQNANAKGRSGEKRIDVNGTNKSKTCSETNDVLKNRFSKFTKNSVKQTRKHAKKNMSGRLPRR
jgi:hypothetical protein